MPFIAGCAEEVLLATFLAFLFHEVFISDGIATVTLDSPHNRNALSRRLVAELASAMTAAAAESVRALVLTHDGPVFCSGADLKERAGDADDGSTPGSSPLVDVMRSLMDRPVPTIAAVRGPVRAGGIGLMASCDLVVVHHDVSFALTEVRIGVAAAIISVPILRRVPPGKIAAAMLTGEVFDAAEAKDKGLVTRVVPDDRIEAEAYEAARRIAAGAPLVARWHKRFARRLADPAPLTEAELDEGFACYDTEDFQIGYRAFLDKVAPEFKGR